MPLFFIILHVVVCIALIMIVLLQTGKGADMGAAFGGGGSNTLFGATGASTFLGKLTTGAAIVFMLTSLTLAYMATNRTGSSVLEDQPAVETPSVPAQPDADAQPGGQTTEQQSDAGKQPAGEKEAPQPTEQK
jgi:preprotein translocase subunit SecG